MNRKAVLEVEQLAYLLGAAMETARPDRAITGWGSDLILIILTQCRSKGFLPVRRSQRDSGSSVLLHRACRLCFYPTNIVLLLHLLYPHA